MADEERTTRALGPLTRRLGENLRALRSVRGVSAQRMADALNMPSLTRAAISKIEVGQRGVSLEEVAAVAAFFEIADPWDLVTEARCTVCCGSPPPGFACKTCGAGADNG